MQSYRKSGFTLVECLIAVAITAVLFLATLSALSFARMNNAIEQERTRAHQIVCSAMDYQQGYLNHEHISSTSQATVWDNGTPDDPDDDTVGTLEIEIRDPDTNDVITSVTGNRMILIETTLTWSPRLARIYKKTFRESVTSLKVPIFPEE